MPMFNNFLQEVSMAFSSGARINTNIAAMNSLSALNSINRDLGVHQERLATGKRINSSSDDPSGYVISKKMEGRIRSMNSALDNVGDAQSVFGVAEGAYQKVADLLVQIKEKQTRFSNGAMGADEKDAISTEIKALGQEIDDIVTTTKFNGVSLLNSSYSNNFQVGEGITVGHGGGEYHFCERRIAHCRYGFADCKYRHWQHRCVIESSLGKGGKLEHCNYQYGGSEEPHLRRRHCKGTDQSCQDANLAADIDCNVGAGKYFAAGVLVFVPLTYSDLNNHKRLEVEPLVIYVLLNFKNSTFKKTSM
jgi:hypothetical protein